MILFLAPSTVSYLESLNLKGDIFLRVRVKSGGCSGLQYVFSIENVKNHKDILFSQGCANVIADPLSLNFISGSTVHYKQDMMISQFTLENPKAIAGCGCGSSFSVK